MLHRFRLNAMRRNIIIIIRRSTPQHDTRPKAGVVLAPPLWVRGSWTGSPKGGRGHWKKKLSAICSICSFWTNI